MPRTKKLPPGLWKRGGIYYARFTHGGRTVRKRLSSDLDAAKAMLNDLRARADRGDFGILDNDYSWDELKDKFIRWAKQATRNPGDYERDLKRFEAYSRVANVRQITVPYVLGYREWRLRQPVGTVAGKEWKKAADKCVSPRTVNREVATLQNMMNKAVSGDWKCIAVNPIANLKPLDHDQPRKERRDLTLEEVEAIFREAPAYLLPALRLFCSTGMRRNELVELRFSDIDFDARCITIRRAVAKSKKAREIPLDDYSITVLTELRDQAKTREPIAGKTPPGRFSRDHVFVTAWNTPLRNNLLRAFYAVCKRAKIEGAEQGGAVDLHSLRVTFATLAIDHGASPKAVQSILGHSTLELTMKVYAKATDKAKRAAVAALPFTVVTTPDHIITLDRSRTESVTPTKTDSQPVTMSTVAAKTA